MKQNFNKKTIIIDLIYFRLVKKNKFPNNNNNNNKNKNN